MTRKEFETRFNLALHIGNGTIWEWDIQTNKISFGPRFHALLGYQQGELPTDIYELHRIIHTDDQLKVRNTIVQHLKGNTDLYEHETRFLKKSGEILWILERGKVIKKDAMGKALQMIGIGTDITEYKLREEATRLQSEIISHMTEGIVLIRVNDGTMVYTNRSFEKMFEYDAGTLLGKHISILKAPGGRSFEEITQEIVEALTKHNIWKGEIKKIRKDGTTFWGLATLTSYKHPQHGKVWLTIQTDISIRKEAEATLRDSEEQFRAIFEQSSDSILLIDPDNGKILAFNQQMHQNLGYTRTEFEKLSIPDFEAMESKEEVRKHIVQIQEKKWDIFQTQHRTKSGAIRDVEVTIRIIHVKNKEYFFAAIHDITDQKLAEKQQRLASTVFESATEAIMVTDSEVNIIAVNPAFTEITGYALHEVQGKNPQFLKSGKHDDSTYKKMWDIVEETGHWQGELWDRRKNGDIFPIWLSITAIKDQKGEPLYYTSLFSDITERIASEEKLHAQAYYDSLTNLPNQRLMKDRLSQALNQAKRTEKKVGILFIDLDHFKSVNDTLGHLAGDHILKEAGKRLLASVRDADTVARSGGDEFQIILPNTGGKEEVSLVAKKIIKEMSLPFMAENRQVFLGASIGITIFPDDGDQATFLLKNADMAMYKAKFLGRNSYHFFDQNMEKLAKGRAVLGWDLKKAVTQNELSIFYQPIIHLETLKTVALEALVRWHHPDQGLLLPEKFIPVAEESGTIGEIGQMVLERACQQMYEWQKTYGLKASLSVNMSSRQFILIDFLHPIKNALENSGLSPESLTIECTESLTLDPVEKAAEKLNKLKALGVHIAIDDFGTGYSSLSYLSRFPIDQLKIDKSFIQNVHSSPQKQHLVEAIIRMGESLKTKVIAEGIEQQEDLDLLLNYGCHSGQGYYFSKPLSAKNYEALLKKEKGLV